MVTNNPDLEEIRGEMDGFNKASLQLNRITRELQDLAMAVRMIPIRPTFRKMFRLVRDLSHKLDKDVELVVRGEDTEVDKTVIENIADPIVHLIRNSIDHGLESRQERQKTDKSATGTVELDAHHEGGEVWIVVKDDGRGLDRQRILAKARERGLLSSSGDEMSDNEVFNLIFEPGFSTAQTVSGVSGRGVGMDVVKRNIQKLGGRIDVDSEPGTGTQLTMRIPLTLAIIEGMQVQVGNRNYTIPMLEIRESVSAPKDAISRLTDGTEVVCLRGSVIPIVRLHHLHNIDEYAGTLEDGILVVIEDGARSVCLFVDQLLGQRQTVIKALPDYLGHLGGLSGCSILSNGDISLILDTKSLLSRAQHLAA